MVRIVRILMISVAVLVAYIAVISQKLEFEWLLREEVPKVLEQVKLILIVRDQSLRRSCLQTFVFVTCCINLIDFNPS